MSDPEPARPPPPKSYVPINLLEEAPLPSLPPRPQEGPAANGVMPPPRPQPRNVPPPPSSSSSAAANIEEGASKGDPKKTAPPSDMPPLKPERKHKKGPPKPPSPYAATTKRTTQPPLSADELNSISFDFNDPDGPTADSAGTSSRRHTISSRPKSNEDEDSTAAGKGSEFSRPKLSPPDVMLESLYSTVDKKNRRYPAPNVPAPPPPYEGNTLKEKTPPPGSGSLPPAPPPPSGAILEPDSADKLERSISPPGYEPVSSVNTTSTGGLGKGPPGPVGGGRVPPGRPSRPPAANPPPSKTDPRSRSATYSNSSSAGIAAARAKAKKGKGSQRPQITVMDARPMNSDAIPSPYLQPVETPKLKPPSTRPSPPQPKRPTSADGSPKVKPPSKRPSPPQPKKPDASAPKPPSPPTSRPSPPQPRKQISEEQLTPTTTEPQGSPPKPERSRGNSNKPPPMKPGQSPPQKRRPPPPKVGHRASPPAPRKVGSGGAAAAGEHKRPPPPSVPVPPTVSATPTEGTPQILEQLSVLGPPPDEELPELPTEVGDENVGHHDDEEPTDPVTPSTPLEDEVKVQPPATTKDPPSKPPHPARPPPAKRGKPPRPNISPPNSEKQEPPSKPPAPSTAAKHEPPKHPAPSGRPPPPKFTRHTSHDQKDSAPDTPTLSAVGKAPSSEPEPIIEEGEATLPEIHEAEVKPSDSAKPPEQKGNSPAPKRPPPMMKRPPAPRPPRKQSSTDVVEETAQGANTRIHQPATSRSQSDLGDVTEGVKTEETETPPTAKPPPPSQKRPPRPVARKTAEGVPKEGGGTVVAKESETSIGQEEDNGQTPPEPVSEDKDQAPVSKGKGQAPPPRPMPVKRPPLPTSRRSTTEIKAPVKSSTEAEVPSTTQEKAVEVVKEESEASKPVAETHEPSSSPDPPPTSPAAKEDSGPCPGSKQPSQPPAVAKKKSSIKRPPPPVKPKSHSPSPAVTPSPSVTPSPAPQTPSPVPAPSPSVTPNPSVSDPNPPTPQPSPVPPQPTPSEPPVSPATSDDVPLPPLPVADKRTSTTKPAPPPTAPKSRTPVSPNPPTTASKKTEAEEQIGDSKDLKPTAGEERASSTSENAQNESPSPVMVLSKPPPPKATHPKPRPPPPGQPPKAKKPQKPLPPPAPQPQVKVSAEEEEESTLNESPPTEGSRRGSSPIRLSRGRPSSAKVKGEREEHVEEGVHVLRYSDSKSGASSREHSPAPLQRKAKGGPMPVRPVSMPPGKESPGQQPKNEQNNTADSAVPGRPFPPPPTTSKPAPVKPPSTKPAPPKPSAPPPASKPSGPPRPGGPPKPPPPSASNKPARPSAPGRPGAPPTKPSAPPTTALQPKPAVRKTSAPQNPAGRSSNNPPPLPARPTPGHILYKYVCSEPHGLATAHHDATEEDELSYQEGDVIELIEKVDEYWYYAANADLGLCEGLILASNLKIVKRLPGQDTVAGFEEGPCAVATHDFQGETEDELSFKAGDLIMLKTHYGEEWFRGKLVNGKQGIFPKTYVEVVEELPPDAYEAPPPSPTAAQATVDTRAPYGVALYSFSAEAPGELSISEGDQVELIEQVDASWLKGRLRGKEGIFPADFVTVTGEVPAKGAGGKTAGSKGNVCTALFDFDGQAGELSFKAGDKITLVSRVDSDWINGEIGGRKGMFPASFADSVPADLPLAGKEEADKSSSSAAVSSKAEGGTGKCKALFDFQGEGDGELSFAPGDMIDTLAEVDADWLRGRIGSKEGIFPKSFVEVISEIPKSSAPVGKQSKAAEPVSLHKTSARALTDDLMPKAVAAADYNAKNSDEISFTKGEVLYLLTNEGGGMFMGERVETGDLGNFPANYVDVVVPLP